MKLLVVVSSIYDKDLFKKRKTITGIEIMVRDILNGVSNEMECFVFTTSLKSKGLNIGKIQLLSNNLNCFFWMVRKEGLYKFKKNYDELKGKSIKERFNLAVSLTMLNHHISMISPDIVNIHDLNDWNTIFLQKILPTGVKVLLTDHLYVGKKEHSYGYNSLRNNEEKIFNSLHENLYVSFVSTGMRKRFLNDYPVFSEEKAYCVVNGTNISCYNKNIPARPNIFEKMQGKKVLLCIGSFTARKNQQAIIETFGLMNQEEKSKVCILFIGAGRMQKIKDNLFSKSDMQSLYYIGKVTPSEMASYYYYCDGTITTSLNESFGLTIIEGFMYGKPAILFNDIDSFADLYDKNVCVPIIEHNNIAIKNAINEFLDRKWNSQYITQFVEKFSLERVHKEYLMVYKNVLYNCKRENKIN